MWKKISVVAGGMALAVALPFVALAITTDEFPEVLVPADAATEMVQTTTQTQATVTEAPVEPTGPWTSPNAVDPITVQQNEQVMVRQQLRVHAETGPPEGFEPIQQRLHVDDPLGMGPGNDNAGQGQQMGNGNPNAPMAGAGTGECTNDPSDCPNAGDPDQAMMNQNRNMVQSQTQVQDQTQTQDQDDTTVDDTVRGNPNAPMAGAGTGDPEDCPNDGPVGTQGTAGQGRGGRNG